MRGEALRLAVAAVAISLGVLAALFPGEWVEEWIGIEPDGGSGLLELLVALVPIALGIALATPTLVRVVRRYVSGRAAKAT